MCRLPALCIGIILLLALPASGQPRSLTSPSLACRVAPSLPQDLRPGSPIIVSNLERIDLTVVLTHSQRPNDLQLHAVVHPQAPPEVKRNIEISVSQISGARRTQIPVKIHQSGHSGTLTTVSAHLLMEVPLDAAKRRENIIKFLDRIEAEGKNGTVNDRLLQGIRENREAYIKMFEEHYYMENRVGLFEIRCAYTGTRPDFWMGRLEAPPTRIKVIFKGNFSDQPAFR